jgi:hypothetical protein
MDSHSKNILVENLFYDSVIGNPTNGKGGIVPQHIHAIYALAKTTFVFISGISTVVGNTVNGNCILNV